MEEYTPSEEEQKIVTYWKAQWENANKAKADRQAVIDNCYKFYKGDHLTLAQKLKKHGPKSKRNYIFTSVEDTVALLTDNNPSFGCWPRDNRDDIQIASKTKQVLQYVWEVTKMDEKLPMATRDSIIGGIGGLKIDFDSQINYPYGEINVSVVPAKYIYPDPDATSEDDCRFIIQRTPKPLWMIKKHQSGKGIYVKADDSISMEPDSTTKSAETSREYMGTGAGVDAKHNRAWEYEIWVKDDSEHEEDEFPDEEKGYKKGDLKYPNGKKIVIAGDILLEDGGNPFEDGDHPFVFLHDYEQTDSFWSLGDVENIIDINEDINKIVSRLNEYVKNTCHTTIVYDEECGIDEKSVNNLEGNIIKKNAAGTVQVVPPPSWPGFIFEILTVWKQDTELSTGTREVLQGRSPKAGTSGAAFERLQEFALSRVRKRARNVDNALVRVGKKFVSRIRQFYPENRQIRITGDFPITTPEGQPMMENGQQMFRNYDFIDFSGNDLRREDGRNVELDVILEVGSAATVTRNQDRVDAAWLFEKGIIDREEVARRYDISNFKEIKARMEAEQLKMMQQQAQIQAQANLEAQMKGGGPGAPTGAEIPNNGQISF